MERRRGSRTEEVKSGEWKPLIFRQKRFDHSVSRGKNVLFTISVDNLPRSTHQAELRKLLTNFGVVKDIFTLNKTRARTRSIFGFVRYSCSVAVDIAIQKANGLWCKDSILRVKRAEFKKSTKATKISSSPSMQTHRHGFGANIKDATLGKSPHSLADVLKRNHRLNAQQLVAGSDNDSCEDKVACNVDKVYYVENPPVPLAGDLSNSVGHEF
ncbi:hypothetical protein F0562_001648 [Nyssa sinensis]|uniref:RRM domain-containing protein n=1 Tax=Nyssa sinensis TaxID=561372 RepID=A0A5J5C530_9ASTE|nr:hypothetical protein F0562_001648 [Nyssa sinensis]